MIIEMSTRRSCGSTEEEALCPVWRERGVGERRLQWFLARLARQHRLAAFVKDTPDSEGLEWLRLLDLFLKVLPDDSVACCPYEPMQSDGEPLKVLSKEVVVSECGTEKSC